MLSTVAAMIRRALLPLFAVGALAGCEIVLGPDARQGLPDGVQVELSVSPDEVLQHAPFVVRLDMTNTRTTSVDIVTSGSCLAVVDVLRGSARVPFRGSNPACNAAITRHTIGAGETRSVAWDLRAELYAAHAGDPEGAPAAKGAYTVTASVPLQPDRRRPSYTSTLQVQ
jgi:hypothetical protein